MRKEVHQQLRISAVQDFLKLMRTKSVPEFGEVWKNYYRKYLDLNQLDWLKYLDSTWLKHPEKWWSTNRSVSTSTYPNRLENLLNTLKGNVKCKYQQLYRVIAQFIEDGVHWER